MSYGICILHLFGSAEHSIDNPFDDEMGMFQDNKVDSMAADALAHYAARPSAVMLLTI